jgi:Tol biopolymer transport system component
VSGRTVFTGRFLAIAGTVLVPLLLVGCGSSGQPETRVQADPPAGKLAVSLGGGKRGFRVTDLEGRRLRKIVVPRGHHLEIGGPTFTVNGDELWFLSLRGMRFRLHIYPTSGQGRGSSSPVVLDGHGGGRLLVSPDGDRMAIGAYSGWCRITVILGRDGELIQKLSAPGFVDVAPLSWSRDGSRLLYSLTRYRNSDCGKYGLGPSELMVHRQGTRRDQRIVAARNASFTSSAWSPDGRRIALTECNNAEDWSCRLVVIDADGRARRDLGNLGIVEEQAQPVWAVTTNEIVTPRQMSPRAEGMEIWAFNLDSGAGRKVADSGSTDGASVDGSLIADINGVLDVETGQHWPFPANVERRTQFGDRLGPAAYFLEEPK